MHRTVEPLEGLYVNLKSDRFLLIDVRLHQKMGIYTITKSFTGLAMYTDTGIFLLGNQVKIFINKLLLKR